MDRTPRIVMTSRAPKRIVVTGVKARGLSPRKVAAALGAEVLGPSRSRPQSPIGLIALRERVTHQLHSSGGRPALEGAESRQKIPLMKGDWERLKRIAARVSEDSARQTTPGQVASLLLHMAIERTLHTASSKPSRRA